MHKALERRLRKIEASFVDATDQLCVLPPHELERRVRAMSDSELDRHIAVLARRLERGDAS